MALWPSLRVIELISYSRACFGANSLKLDSYCHSPVSLVFGNMVDEGHSSAISAVAELLVLREPRFLCYLPVADGHNLLHGLD